MHPIRYVRCPDIKEEKTLEIARIVQDIQNFGRFDVPPLQPPLDADIRIRDNKLCIGFTGACDNTLDVALTLGPLRRLIKDYRIICENYSEAVALADPSKVETIDAGRKTFHDEGGEWLMERLEGYFKSDLAGCRYLFSLVNVLYL